MNINIFFIILSLTFYTANAQVQISTINYKRNHSFPFIHSKNATIAKNINSYLQKQVLQNEKIETSPYKIFENSKYIYSGTLQQSGYSWIKYQVETNNPEVLSLSFVMENTGAYSQYNHKYYNFNLQTGKLIVAKDLFTVAGLNYLRKFLIGERKKRIDSLLRQESVHAKDSTFIMDTYKKCNQEADEDNISIKPYCITFYKDHCFPHAWRPYDTNLDIEFKIRQLETYLTETGKMLLLLNK